MNQMCFFSEQPAEHATEQKRYIIGVIDLVDPHTSRGIYTGQTLQQLQQEYADVQQLDLVTAIERMESVLIGPPIDIQQDRFDDMLTVMPPVRWYNEHDRSAFQLCERFSGNIALWFVRIGNRYFECRQRFDIEHNQLFNFVLGNTQVALSP